MEDRESQDSGISRRELLRRGALAGAGLVAGPGLLGYATACGATSSPVTLGFVSFGGAYQRAQARAWLDPFMRAHPNIEIVQHEPIDYAKLEAQVHAGNVTWDVADVSNDFGLARNKDILTPIDPKIVKNAGNALPGVLQSPWRVADIVYASVLAYRKDEMPQGRVPQGWRDFFDLKAFPGKRGLRKFASAGALEFALVADGVDPHRLYPLDVERALKKLDTIKSEIVWWDTGAQSARLLADGEVTIGHSWNGRVYDIQQQGAPVQIQWNQAFQTQDFLVVPKGTKHPHEAMQLVDYITSCAHAARLSYYIPYAPPYACALGSVDPKIERDLPTTYNGEALHFDDRWWDAHFAAVDAQFQSWLQA